VNKNYRLNFYLLGVSDDLISQLDSNQIEIKRKGDIWNKRTGKRYNENIVKKIIYTTYEEGFQLAVDKLISFIGSNPQYKNIIAFAKEVTMQICIDLDEECRVPYIKFTSEQLAYLSAINSDIDFHIS
jgi:hypothetical protein